MHKQITKVSPNFKSRQEVQAKGYPPPYWNWKDADWQTYLSSHEPRAVLEFTYINRLFGKYG